MIFSRRRPRNLVIQIIPMIDVMFFLVTFFMVFTTFKTETMGLNIELPKAITAAKQSEGVLVVNVNQNGTIYYQDRAITAEQLRQSLRPIMAKNPQAVVVIKADERVAYRSVVTVMDSVRAVGGYRIALAVERVTTLESTR